jgi:hypothetical protein
MNATRLIVDQLGNVYLKVMGKPLRHPAYFKVESFATKPEGKIKDITIQEMIVNLKGEN